jgi:CRISPR/Cas system CSM-associated protein Csm2 small subunit
MTLAKKEKKPYYVNMEVDMKKIENLPPDINSGKLFMQVCVGAAVRVSKQTNGMSMQDQRRLYSMRNTMENAIAAGEWSKVEIDYDDFKFLMRMWESQNSEASMNELLMIVEGRLKEAESKHDEQDNTSK